MTKKDEDGILSIEVGSNGPTHFENDDALNPERASAIKALMKQAHDIANSQGLKPGYGIMVLAWCCSKEPGTCDGIHAVARTIDPGTVDASVNALMHPEAELLVMAVPPGTLKQVHQFQQAVINSGAVHAAGQQRPTVVGDVSPPEDRDTELGRNMFFNGMTGKAGQA